jgi:hypothetical protein
MSGNFPGADLLGTTASSGRPSHLEQRGGRGGRPAALSTRRVHIKMLRALARPSWASRRRPPRCGCRPTGQARRRR